MSSHSGEAGDMEPKRQRHAEPEKNIISVMDPTTTTEQLDMVQEAAQVVQPKDRPSSSSGTKSESPPPYFEYDVFINFRGEDTRKSFVGHLYRALVQKGVSAYLDSEDLRKGDSINELFSAIERSAAFITIFSKRYAESEWCLMEIEKIVDSERKILPIFYDVKPTEVTEQTGAFKEGFEKHMHMHMHREEVDKWKEAMSKAGSISGYTLEDEYHGDEARLIANVVKEVLNEVCNKVQIHVAEHPVGMDFHLRKMMDMLQTEQVNKVRFVGICGIGGLGKTSIAKATFNEFSSKFECSSFLGNVRAKENKEGGILQLQKDLIRDLFSDENPCITDASRGIELIKRRVHGKRVLVVLDDVDKRDQIQYLVGDGTCLHEGSRVVITTRDRGVLTGNYGLVEEEHIYSPDKLNEIQSLELFRHFAFKRGKPVDSDEDLQLAAKIVDSIGGLPLVLKVLGSHFSRFEMEDWRELLEEMMQVPHNDVQRILRISYDGLGDKEKRIFLDIACFFLGGLWWKKQSDRENAIYMWKACNLKPKLSIRVLEQKTLLERSSEGEFHMHDEIRDMALEIIRQEDPNNPLARSRVYKSDDRCLSPFHELGSLGTEALLFDATLKATVTRKSLSAMPNLRMLIGDPSCRHSSRHQLKYDFRDKEEMVEEHETDSLVTSRRFPQPNWLRWCHYPYETLPQKLMNFDQLAVLELPDFASECLRLGSSRSKEFHNLKVLDLSGSRNLRKTPDFSVMPHLERLALYGCDSLKEISPSIGQLKNLVEFDLFGCKLLEKLVGEIGWCTSLKVLTLEGCSKLSSLPKSIGNLTNLTSLNLEECSSMVSLPEEICRCNSLQQLNFGSCQSLTSLPRDIGNLTSLSEFGLSHTGVVELPESFSKLTMLKELNLYGCRSLKELPSTIGSLRQLQRLLLSKTSIRQLPSSISNCTSLTELDCGDNRNLSSLPTEIGSLTSLAELNLGYTSISGLPGSMFSRMTMLKKLDLGGCWSLKEFPSTMGYLEQAEMFSLSSTSIREVPNSICNCGSLIGQDCDRCYSTPSILPTNIGSLTSLETLNLNGTSISGFPRSFSGLTMLKELHLRGCRSLKELPITIGCLEQLQEIDLSASSVSELPGSLGRLKNLVKLDVSQCRNLVMLPEEMCGCTSITELDCSGCTSLSSLPRDIGNLTSLSTLHLNGTRITELPESFGNLTMLSQLSMSQITPTSMRRLFHTVEFHKLDNITIPGVKPSEQLFENQNADAILQFTLPNIRTTDHETKVTEVVLECCYEGEHEFNGVAVTSFNEILNINMFDFTLDLDGGQDLTNQLGSYLVGKKAVEVWLLGSKLVNMRSADALGNTFPTVESTDTINCYLSVEYARDNDYY